MLKEALKSVSASIVDAAETTVHQYKPTPKNVGGVFEKFARGGIASIGSRSPILSDLASSLLDNFNAELDRRDMVSNLVKSDKTDSLKEHLKSKLQDPTEKNVHKEAFNILEKITKSIQRHGLEETKKTDLYKEYSSHIDHLIPEKTQYVSGTNPTNLDLDSITKILNVIAQNTQKTANILSSFQGSGKFGESSGNGSGSHHVYIDPATGQPSLTAAVGGIGSKFLSKVFDDSVIEKFSKKFREIIGIDKSESETQTETSKDLNTEKNSSVENLKESVDESNKINLKDLNTEKNSTVENLKESVDESNKSKPTSTESESTVKTNKSSSDIDDFIRKVESFKPFQKDSKGNLIPTRITSSIQSAKNVMDSIQENIETTNKKSNTISIEDVNTEKNSTVENLKESVDESNKSKSTSTESESEHTKATEKIESKTHVILQSTLEEIKKLNENITKHILNMSVQKKSDVDSSISSIGDSVFSKLKTKLPNIGKLTTVAKSKLGGVVTDIKSSKVSDALKKVASSKSMSGALGSIKTGLGDAITASGRVASYIPKIASKGGSMASMMGSTLLDSIPSLITKIQSSTVPMGKGIGSTIAKTGGGMIRAIPESLSAIKTIGKDILSGGKSVGTSVLSKSSGLIRSGASIAGNVLSKAAPIAEGLAASGSSLVSAAAPLALPALGVAAAGAAGYGVGKYVVNPLIDKGISTVTGGKSLSLGDFIADKFKSDAEKQYDIETAKFESRTKNIENTKNTQATQIEALTQKKEQQSAASSQSAPNININNSSPSGSKPTRSGNTNSFSMIPSVRNTDSTFERVQMQDFWARAI